MKGAGAAHQSVSDCSLDWSYIGVPVLIHFVYGARVPCFDPGLFHLLIQLSSNKCSYDTKIPPILATRAISIDS